MKRFIIPLLLAALAGGCASVSISDNDRSMVVIENAGWYLFNFIPIASGDHNRPNRLSTCWFSDVVTLGNNVKMLDSIMAEQGAIGVRNLTSYTTDEKVLVILLARRAYHTSAELIFPRDGTGHEKSEQKNANR